MIWALVLLAGVAALPLVVEATRKRMDDKARQAAPGRFATLSQGVTHYQWAGPEDGPVIICIHGLTTPSFVWQGIGMGLAAKGFRVLTYDLYGRGFSDRPPGRQDAAFFLRQLNDLLADQHVENDVTVVGYSMGGAIATVFAADQPLRVRQLILLAPAGTAPVGNGVLNAFIGLPVLGIWLMLLRYPGMLRRGLRAEAHLPSSVPGITSLQEAELGYRGFIPAVRSSLLGMLKKDLQKAHERVQRAGVPVLAIWGGQDDVIPLSAMDRLTSWNGNAENHVIEGAGHGLTYTHTPQVLRLIEDFLERRG